MLLWATVWAAAAPARGDCLKPPLELLWSYPAEGQRDVPLDATFWVLASQGAATPPVSATLDGQHVPALSSHSDQQLGQAAFRPEALRPDRAYELRITYNADDGASDAFTVRFHTGSKPAGEAKTTIRSQQSRSVAFVDEHPCAALLRLQGCFDTPDQQLSLHTFVQESTNVIGWYIKARGEPALHFWPAACGHPSLIEPSEPPCHYLYGVDVRGELSTLTQYCGPAAHSSQVFSKDAAPSYAGVLKPTRQPKPHAPKVQAPPGPEPSRDPAHALPGQQAHEKGCGGCGTGADLRSLPSLSPGLLALVLARRRRHAG